MVGVKLDEEQLDQFDKADMMYDELKDNPKVWEKLNKNKEKRKLMLFHY